MKPAHFTHATNVILPVRLPVVSTDVLWHRGDLDQPAGAPRATSSLEGCLLSCSPSEEADEAWDSIARLGGFQRWVLRKPGGFRLLDFHALGQRSRTRFAEAAVASGIAQRARLFRASYWDPDSEDRRYTLHADRSEARAEVAEYDWPRVTPIMALTATSPLISYWQSRHRCAAIDPIDIEDATLAFLLDRYRADVDGILWDDSLDESLLSAPRVGLFQRTVAHVSKHKDQDQALTC